ncbi:MAG: hypothetical protein JSV78_06235 [Phycisphaerales bacterium]|nr:MAG: hypothetical protein JSV78_06235 [Phycisphaerales bacterium]
MTFPLFERVRAHGGLEGQCALIVAPTATGKSFILAVYRSRYRRDAALHRDFQSIEIGEPVRVDEILDLNPVGNA